MARRRSWHWWRWFGFSAPTGILCLAFVAFLSPGDARIWPARIVGTIQRADVDGGSATLVRRDGHWESAIDAFPVGTATHFAPSANHGFFVVHLADGRFVALTDRSAHRGQLVRWSDPLPSYDGRWRMPGFVEDSAGSYYTAEGQRLGGPAPRPLDPFAVTVRGGLLIIGDHAECPDGASTRESWCQES